MISSLVDTLLDRTVAPGYSKVGLVVRRRLPGWPADPAPRSLVGKHVLVTGATSGLGTATADGLAALGAHVHVVVRNPAKAAELLDPAYTVWECDVADLASVQRFTDAFLASGTRLHGIVHNAGAMPPERSESPQGHEAAMAVHVLGPVAMTEALLPALEDRARVVLVTSGGMYAQALRDDDPEYLKGDYSPTTAYARSKRVQVELLPVLSARWPSLDVHAVHPGWADTPGVQESLPTFRKVTGPFLRDSVEGADTSVWLLAASPAPEPGRLWHDRRPRPTSLVRKTKPTDKQVQRIWDWVEQQLSLVE